MINPHTGQVLTPGTPEYDAFVKAATPELQATGISPTAYFNNQGGGYGAQMMSNPLTNAYSTAFANANTTAGGGQAFAQGVGGMLGFGKQQGYVDSNGMSTGLGSELGGGVSPEFAAYMKQQQVAPSYTPPNPNLTKPMQGMAPIYQVPQGEQSPTVNWQSMPSNSIAGYGNQGMFGGTSPSRTPYTSYKPYQPYQGQSRASGMFGAPTMNYNQANSPWAGNQQQTGWSQTNPWSTARGL